MTTTNVPIKKEIKKIRTSLGCSQEMLAVIIGVGVRTVTRWEHEESHPHQLVLEKIRKIEKLVQKIEEVFETKDAVEWLKTPNQSFSGRTPLKEIAYNDDGIETVINLLGAIEWGIVT